MIAAAGVTVIYNEELDRTSGQGVTMEGKRITAITTVSGKTYRGKMFIDATYVGDLMAAAGVSYTVGREPESQYGEDLAGVRRGDTSPRVHYGQGDKDHFVREVDPYIQPGDPTSGLRPPKNVVSPAVGRSHATSRLAPRNCPRPPRQANGSATDRDGAHRVLVVRHAHRTQSMVGRRRESQRDGPDPGELLCGTIERVRADPAGGVRACHAQPTALPHTTPPGPTRPAAC